MKTYTKMAQAVRLFPLVIAALFSIILLASSFSLYREKVDFLSTHTREDFLEKQKQTILARSADLKIYSGHLAKTIYETIEKRVDTRLDIARRIAENIYGTEKERPVEEITAKIVNMLKALHYQRGDEYFFLCRTDGTDPLSSAGPEKRCEGAFAWSLQPGHISSYSGLPAGQDYKGQELQTWWVPKREEPKTITHKKAGKLFHFLPCDLLIGTGDYIDSRKAAMEQENLDWIRAVYAEGFDRVVVLDKKGEIRFSKGERLTAGERIESADWNIDGKPFNFSFVKEMKKNGQFITLASSSSSFAGEFYAMLLPEWEWAVLTAVNPDSAASHLQGKLTGIRQHNMVNLLLLLGGAVLLLALTVWGTLMVNRKVSNFLSEKLMYDELTGLPNRSCFLLQVKPLLGDTDCASIVSIDIDNFNSINERYSREAGDMLLRQIAQRLRSIFPPSRLCHTAGDEFFVFSHDMLQGKGASGCSSQARIDALRLLFTQPFFLDGSPVEISFSSGCCGKYHKDLSLEELMRRASIALFRAKEAGQGNHRCYTLIEQQIERDKILADSFPYAIDNNEISLVYQPLCVNGSNTLFRLEALSRWHHHELGEISPEEFIPMAEKNGFMLLFSRFLVERVCLDMLEIEKEYGEKPTISINITSRQLLDTKFIDATISILDKADIPRDRLKLEIRENLLSTDTELVLPVMERLQLAGLEMTLDDFGTGASSLSYINKIPIKEIKIDQSFIAGIPDDEESAALIRSAIAIASANNFRVIAEGVENKVQNEWLAREGCTLMQGFFYIEPLDLKEVLLWCKENPSPAADNDLLRDSQIYSEDSATQ